MDWIWCDSVGDKTGSMDKATFMALWNQHYPDSGAEKLDTLWKGMLNDEVSETVSYEKWFVYLKKWFYYA